MEDNMIIIFILYFSRWWYDWLYIVFLFLNNTSFIFHDLHTNILSQLSPAQINTGIALLLYL